MRKVISRQEAAALVQDGMTLGMLGFVTLSVPEELLVSLEERFLAEGHPRDLNVSTPPPSATAGNMAPTTWPTRGWCGVWWAPT